MVKITFNLPRESHRYLIEPISQTSHLKMQLVKKFIKFSTTLSTCDKPHIRYLQNIQKNDFRSVFGRNCRNICAEDGSLEIENVSISNLNYNPVPINEEHRIPLIQELLEIRAGRLETQLTKDEIKSMINILCIN